MSDQGLVLAEEIERRIDQMQGILAHPIRSVQVHDRGEDFLVIEVDQAWMFRLMRRTPLNMAWRDVLGSGYQRLRQPLGETMIPAQHLQVLRKIVTNLQDRPITWAVTGSFGMALQGVPVEVHDIDIQTDQEGAYAIERCFADFVVQPVRYVASERMRSHLGALEVDGIQVEIMGAIQKRTGDEGWEAPIRVERYRRWKQTDALRVPVLSLEYEYGAYLRMGRWEKAEVLRRWLQRNKGGPRCSM